MLKEIKNKIVNAIDALMKATYVYIECKNKEIITDMTYVFDEIILQYNVLIEEEKKVIDKINEAKIIVLNINESKDMKVECDTLISLLDNIRISTINLDSNIKVLFLPYKYSMWDAMESVYEAACLDNKIECSVMPIPYYEKDNNGNNVDTKYEGDMFSIDIIDYRDMLLKDTKYDVIFIHYPYDQNNKITAMYPEYCTYNLIKSCSKLVYIPYYIDGCTTSATIELVKIMTTMPGELNSDMVILPNDTLKQVYLSTGIEGNKYVVLGSPKVDAVINKVGTKEYPPEWLSKKGDRKVILLNNSIDSILKYKNYIDIINKTIQVISQNDNILLLWRPHPLLANAVVSMMPEYAKTYVDIIYYCMSKDNIIIDENEDSLPAMFFSDALISDYSSLLPSYVFTGKPMLSLTENGSTEDKIIFCDYFACDFYQDGVYIEKFIDKVIAGDDPRKEERVRRAKNSIVNSDGTCGQKIIEEIKKYF